MAASLIEYHTYRYIDTCMHAHIYLHIHYATLHYTALHYIYILLHCIGLRYTRLHCIALYCIAFAFYKRTSTHTKRSNGTFTENLGQRRPMMGADHAGSWGFLSAQEDFWYFGPFRSGAVYGNDWWHGLGGPIWGAKGPEGPDAGGRCWNFPPFLPSDKGDKVYSPVQWKIPNKRRFFMGKSSINYKFIATLDCRRVMWMWTFGQLIILHRSRSNCRELCGKVGRWLRQCFPCQWSTTACSWFTSPSVSGIAPQEVFFTSWTHRRSSKHVVFPSVSWCQLDATVAVGSMQPSKLPSTEECWGIYALANVITSVLEWRLIICSFSVD